MEAILSNERDFITIKITSVKYKVHYVAHRSMAKRSNSEGYYVKEWAEISEIHEI